MELKTACTLKIRSSYSWAPLTHSFKRLILTSSLACCGFSKTGEMLGTTSLSFKVTVVPVSFLPSASAKSLTIASKEAISNSFVYP
ncbi:hypothetical protein EVA_18397 [gut metagenome]|uniref:Uncharacterized protein n=1 Tax=gut metagenome TaxID=749906 RepID=J9FV95_9ZZZZ